MQEARLGKTTGAAEEDDGWRSSVFVLRRLTA